MCVFAVVGVIVVLCQDSGILPDTNAPIQSGLLVFTFQYVFVAVPNILHDPAAKHQTLTMPWYIRLLALSL